MEHLKHLKHTLETCVIRPSSSRGWWRNLAAASCANDWPGPGKRQPHFWLPSHTVGGRGGEGRRWLLALGCGGNGGPRRARGRQRVRHQGASWRGVGLGGRCGRRGAASNWARRKKPAFVIFRWTVRGSKTGWSVGPGSQRPSGRTL
jgi:hypothetical protein